MTCETDRQTDKNIVILAFIRIDVYLLIPFLMCMFCVTWEISWHRLQPWTWYRLAWGRIYHQPLMSIFVSNWRKYISLNALYVPPELFCDMMNTNANRYLILLKASLFTLPYVTIGFYSMMIRKVCTLSVEKRVHGTWQKYNTIWEVKYQEISWRCMLMHIHKI